MKVYLHTQSDSPNQFFLEVVYNRPYNGGGDPVADAESDRILGLIGEPVWAEEDREVGDDSWTFKACFNGGLLAVGAAADRLVTAGYAVEVQAI